MLGKIIFNADAFGISKGVNQAVVKAYEQGLLNSASLMVNQKYTKEAVDLSENMPNLKMGLHINLTNEQSCLSKNEIPLLVDKNGKFKNGFAKLLWLSVFKYKQLKEQAQKEIEAQIVQTQALHVSLDHVDSYRHVHMIPAIFAAVKELAEKYNIKRIRTVKECGLLTAKCSKGFSYLFNGGIIKYCLLRFLDIINGYDSCVYSYTMLYDGRLSENCLHKVLIPQGFKAVEVMTHPGLPEIDKKYSEDVFDCSILSDWRQKELQTLLNKQIADNFVFGAKYPWPLNWYIFLENMWFKWPQKLRFLLVGGFNTVFAYSLFALFFAVAHLPYMWALIIQNIITINFSIFTMRYYVFQSKGNFLQEYCKAWGVYLWMFFFNSIALTFGVEVCHIYELWAQAIYLVISTVMTYLLHKYFSFYKKIKEK